MRERIDLGASGHFETLSSDEALAQFRVLADSLPIGVALVDDDGIVRFGNERFEQLLDIREPEGDEDPFDVHRWSVVDEDGEPFEEGSPLECLETFDEGSARTIGVDRSSGERAWLSVRFHSAFEDGSRWTRMVTFENVTERVKREPRYERRVQQQAAIARLGQLGLETDDLDDFIKEVCQTVSDVLGNEYCKVLELDGSANQLFVREGVGWDEGVVGGATVASDENSQAGYTLLTEEPVVVEDLEAETRFTGPELLTSHDIVSGISTIIGSTEEPWGILGTHDDSHQEFAYEDIHFVQAVTNILATTIEQWEHQSNLSALNHLNDTIRDIAVTASEQSCSDQIEQRLCDRLVETEQYVFAWIGSVARGCDTVTPTASAGDGKRYLGELERSNDTTSHKRELTEKAIRTGEPQFRHDIRNEPGSDLWHELAERYDYRSSAAVPIGYEDATNGVLHVYASEPFAFDGPQAETLADLGRLIGHAIHTISQQKALVSDTVTELEFRVEIPDHPLLEASTADGVSIRLDRRIPHPDEGYLQFITVAGMERDEFETTILRTENVEEVQYITERDGKHLFELRIPHFPISDALAGLGGRVPKVSVSDGSFRMFAEIPTDRDVREVVESLQETYPSTKLLAQRTTARSGKTQSELHRVISDVLTDRQWRVLETAYFAGYFEWPREKSGAEVAALLDISPPTFSEHIRTVEQAIAEALLEDHIDRP